jgi:hypothetical protein
MIGTREFIPAQRFEYRNPKILAHAKGQPCQNCGREDGSTVAAHSNFAEHGKAKGMNAHDLFVAELCGECHRWLDSGTGRDPSGIWQSDRGDKREMFIKAMTKTMIILLRDGVVK